MVNAINHGLPPSAGTRCNLNFLAAGKAGLRQTKRGRGSYQSGKRLADTDEAICARSAAARANIYGAQPSACTLPGFVRE